MDIEDEIRRVDEFVARGNFHAAINIALSAMNDCRRREDQAGVDRMLGIIQDIVTTLRHSFGSDSPNSPQT